MRLFSYVLLGLVLSVLILATVREPSRLMEIVEKDTKIQSPIGTEMSTMSPESPTSGELFIAAG